MQGMRSSCGFTANRNGGKNFNNFDCVAYIHRIIKGCGRFVSIIAVICILLNLFCFNSNADELEDQYDELYSLLEVDELEDIGSKNTNQYYEINIKEPQSIWQINGYDLIKQIVVKNISLDGSSLNIISVMLVFTIIYLATKNMMNDKSSLIVPFDTVSAVVCALVVLVPVSSLINDVCNTVKSCCVFMNAFIPVYAALFVAAGYTATSTSYSTLMFSVTQIFSLLADNAFVPLCNVTLVASVGSSFNSISKRYYELLKKAIIIALSSSMGIFITVLNLQTVISAPADTIGLKTVKTALGSFVPIIGSALSDSVSVLLAGAGTLKSTVGVYAVINIVICVVPTLINLLIWRVTVALSCALLELSSAEYAVNIVKCFGNVITLMISVILCVCVAYLLSVILTLSIGG